MSTFEILFDSAAFLREASKRSRAQQAKACEMSARQQPEFVSEYDELTSQLSKNPRDPDAWHRLIQIAIDSQDSARIRSTYDTFLLRHPDNTPAQLAYLDYCIQHNLNECIANLFNKFLENSPCIQVWMRFIDHTRKRNSASVQRHEIKTAYERALSHIGQDRDSGTIWHNYISLLREEVASTRGHQQGIKKLHEVYHSAIQIPLNNVDILWREFESLEHVGNEVNPEIVITNLFPRYLKAREALRQMDILSAPLYHALSPTRLLPPLPVFDASERALVGGWKAYLKWEESNPLGLDETTLSKRIRMVYRKSLVPMTYHTEIWFMAYRWANNAEKEDEAIAFLTRGLTINPSSHLLSFALAEAMEIRKNFQDVHALFIRLICSLRNHLVEAESAGTLFRNAMPGQMTDRSIVPSAVQMSSMNLNGSQRALELNERQKEYNVVLIVYMRFIMRVEGLKAFQYAFSKMRADRWATWETYEAYGLLAYHGGNDKDAAVHIFEDGMTAFGRDPEYVLHYMEFLISINDHKNALALFERAVQVLGLKNARPLWDCWSKHQWQCSDIETILELEERRAKISTTDSSIKRFALRHTYQGVDAIAEHDLGFTYFRREVQRLPGAGQISPRPALPKDISN